MVVTLKTGRCLRVSALFSPFWRHGSLTLEREDTYRFHVWKVVQLGFEPQPAPHSHMHILAASEHQKSCWTSPVVTISLLCPVSLVLRSLPVPFLLSSHHAQRRTGQTAGSSRSAVSCDSTPRHEEIWDKVTFYPSDDHRVLSLLIF